MTMATAHRVLANPFEGWTTIEEAAEMVGRENSTVRGWADKGWITCFSVGRKVRLVNIEEVRNYSENVAHWKRRRGS